MKFCVEIGCKNPVFTHKLCKWHSYKYYNTKQGKKKEPAWLTKIRKGVKDENAAKTKRIKYTSNYDNIQRGSYFCSKGEVFFRSKWEANYALYLDFLLEQGEIKSWEYETEKFVFEEIKFGTRSYTPDFPVTLNDGSREYHETKGYMTSKSRTQLKRMAKYYPDVKINLIEKKQYSEMLKNFKGIIKFY